MNLIKLCWSLVGRRAWQLVLAMGVILTLVASANYALDVTAYAEFFGRRDPGSLRRGTAAAHIFFAAVALLLGLIAFSKWGRSRSSLRRHRFLGHLYVGCVLLSGTAALLIAPFSEGGNLNGLGFATLAVLWLSVTLAATFAAFSGHSSHHSRWAIYSMALTLSGVSLRIQLGVMIGLLDFSFSDAYQIVAWSSWLPNIPIARLWWRANFRDNSKQPHEIVTRGIGTNP